MDSWRFVSRTPDETRAIARELGRAIGVEGLVLALVGPLGAGKTLFVKGLAEGLGVDPRVVSSPTFVIAQQYALSTGPEWLHHVDLYRIESAAELEAMGFDDLLAPGSVLAVEWADRFPEWLGPDVLRVELEGPRVAPDQDAAGEVRAALVSVEGHGVASRVAADWMERVERLDPARPADTAASAVIPLLAVLVGGMLLAGGWPAEAEPPACSRWSSDEVDALGSRVLSCADHVDPSERTPLSGMGRWLLGERVALGQAERPLLEALPGIGPKLAEAIVEARAGADLASMRELERVHGIGPSIRRRLEAWLAIEPGRDDG